MIPEQREVLDEIITKMRAGRLTRRSFLGRAMAVGLSTSAAVSLLEACGGSGGGGNGGTVNLVWQSENDATTTYQTLVNNFNNTVGKQKGIHVTWHQGPSSTDNLNTLYTNTLRARSSTIDIMSIDIIYPAEFGSNQWAKPITDSQWPASQRAQYLPGPVQGCTYQGQIYAAPFRTDVGLLYYRTDLTNNTAPTTFDQLTSMAQQLGPQAKYGYVWQGAQYEGVVCDFVEVLYGYGGSILDPNDPKKVTVNSPEAQQALSEMVGWVGSISPSAVTTYQEPQSLSVWQQGNSVFMRNWPYAYSLSNDPTQSKIQNKFDITTIPHAASQSTGHSCIGGWNLAINAYSQHPDEAWEFVSYMLAPEQQKFAATNGTYTVTLQSVYSDPDVAKKQPLFTKLADQLKNGKPRPVSPVYVDVSNAVQQNVYAALKGQAKPADALNTLAGALNHIVSQ
jgi:multiple sugar transport system substrate-binding protein